MTIYSQQNIRRVVICTDCEDPIKDSESSKWIAENKGEVLSMHKCAEGFIALIHFEPVFAENLVIQVIQDSSVKPVSDSQPSLDLPAV